MGKEKTNGGLPLYETGDEQNRRMLDANRQKLESINVGMAEKALLLEKLKAEIVELNKLAAGSKRSRKEG